MPLTYPPEWKFGNDGVPVPPSLSGTLSELIGRIASGSPDQQQVVETFKNRFGRAAWSTSLDWAYSDLSSAMESRTENGAVFTESFWLAVEDLSKLGITVPTAAQLNALFGEHGFPYRLDPPKLIRLSVDAVIEDKPSESAISAGASVPYTIGEEIGRGGFGIVYRASKKSSISTFQFALKLLDPSPFIANRERAKARFMREVQAVQLLEHRGIVPYVDAGVDQIGRPYLVMPLVNGSDIRKSCEELPFIERAMMMVEVLDAIAHAHSLDVLHRDLKPGNILVRRTDRQPIIVDFGQAYLFDELDAQSLTTAAVGSAGYIPSEILAEPKFRTPLQDIFACGVITYELIASRRPDPSDYRPLSEIHATLGILDPVLRRAIAPAPTRYRAAAEFRDALRAAVQPPLSSPLSR